MDTQNLPPSQQPSMQGISQQAPIQGAIDIAAEGTKSLESLLLEDVRELEAKVYNTPLPATLRENIVKMLKRMVRMAKFGNYSSDYEQVAKYIDWVTSIPWTKYTQDNLDIENAKRVLDSHHYGMMPIKNRIIEYLSVMKLQSQKGMLSMQSDDESGNMEKLQGSSGHAPIICFVGLQGIGKTSMAKSIAQAMGKKFVRIALGAMGDVRNLRGESRVNPDAEPGQIIKAIIRASTMNPLILLDEIDKVSGEGGLRSDVNAALLEILDPEQNATFVDHYIDHPVNLSKVMFITTANNLGTISTALLDRLEVIRFTSYSDEEKQVIARDYLFPKVLKAAGLEPNQIEFTPDVWPLIIRPLGYDAGIRQLERNLTNLTRKVARMILEGKGTHFVINPGNVKEFMSTDITVV